MPKDCQYQPDCEPNPGDSPLSRPDKVTEAIIETAIRITMDEGLDAARAYLRKHDVSSWIALRVLNPNSSFRRKSS